MSLAQRDAVLAALESKNKLSCEPIRKLLELPGAVQFNLEDKKRSELKGKATSATLARKDWFGSAWTGFAQRCKTRSLGDSSARRASAA